MGGARCVHSVDFVRKPDADEDQNSAKLEEFEEKWKKMRLALKRAHDSGSMQGTRSYAALAAELAA